MGESCLFVTTKLPCCSEELQTQYCAPERDKAQRAKVNVNVHEAVASQSWRAKATRQMLGGWRRSVLGVCRTFERGPIGFGGSGIWRQ